MVNAFRYGLLGVTDIVLWQAFVIIVGFVFALGAFAMWLLRRGVGIKQ
jgi:ABC-2 type transport system permease protein